MSIAVAESIVPRGGVKICGIREPRHAVAAVRAGADMLGFNFAPSRRRVSVEEAVACIRAVHWSNAAMVGLFVDAGADEINRVCRAAGLDAVQLHGDITPELVRAVEAPVIHVLAKDVVATSLHAAGSRPFFNWLIGSSAGTSVPRDAGLQNPMPDTDSPIAYLIDGYLPGAHGGTGMLADWALAAALAPKIPLMLAGGLSAENVARAISEVRPRAVDVSSGVETGGVKDAARIRAFVETAKAAFAVT